MILHGARKLDADGLVDGFWMIVDDGAITQVGSGAGWRDHAAGHDVVDARGEWLTPGFIDLHAHGGGGFSFEDGPGSILGALAVHRDHGTTRSVVSLVSNPVDDLCSNLEIIAELTADDPLVLGAHLEGPFLSVSKRGAHDPAFLLDPDLEALDRLINSAHGTLRQLTIAPELPNALEAISVLTEAGVAVAVGHTEADYARAAKAFEVGARILTHAFNAMPGIHHRHPGPVVAAFDNEYVTLELVLDAVHVDPRIARLAFDEAPGRVALVTDAMAAAGSADGDYRLGSQEVTVSNGHAVLTGTTTIAGSTLTQDAALKLAVTRAGVDPRTAVEALTSTPAEALGLGRRFGRLKAGYAADAVLLDHEWSVLHVWADGRPLR